MKDYRFALNNQRLWEDLFVCCEWRIQRNLSSGKKRLLDHWNIIRHEGSFQDCRNAFDCYAKAFELKIPQNNHIVIMLHGYGQTAKVFYSLKKQLSAKGFFPLSINYPSTRRNTKSHAAQIHTILKNIPHPNDISFITYGAGNLIMEKLLNQKNPFPKNAHIHRIIEINPPINKNILIHKLCRIKFFKSFLGLMGKELAGNYPTKPFSTPFHIKTIITKPKFWKEFILMLLYGKIKIPTADDFRKCCGAEEVITIDEPTDSPLQSIPLQKTILHFLKN